MIGEFSDRSVRNSIATASWLDYLAGVYRAIVCVAEAMKLAAACTGREQ